MNVVIWILILVPLAMIVGITFAIAKFTHLILQQQGIKYAKAISIFVAILAVSLILFWLDSALSGKRWLGC